jgi:uncharacterized protein (TIGR02246 family)
MKPNVLVAFAACATIACILPAQRPRPERDERSATEIRALFDEFNAAWERRDPAFIERFYAHDTDELFFFERRQLTGWDKIRELYGNMFASASRGTVKSSYSNLHVRARGDVGWLAVNFRLEVREPDGTTSVDEGRESMVFERQGGRWVVVHRHTSFQAPAGAQRHVPLATGTGALWSPDAASALPDEERGIRAARERSNRAIAAHDTAGIAAEWMPNVNLVSSAGLQIEGRDANTASIAQQFVDRPDVIYVRTTDSVRVFAPWGMSAEYGTWRGSWTQGPGKIEIGGPYFGKWQKAGDRWRIQAEIFVPTWCRGGSFCDRRP